MTYPLDDGEDKFYHRPDWFTTPRAADLLDGPRSSRKSSNIGAAIRMAAASSAAEAMYESFLDFGFGSTTSVDWV